jgi:Fungal specific transcription factor domain
MFYLLSNFHPYHRPVAADSPYSGSQTSTSSHSSRGMGHVPTVLLLAMFSIAARYSSSTPLPPQGVMWPAGDIYLESAKMIMGSTYSTPRVGTCQALLLLGYREIGIGDMAQAWIYVGMAVRMAQDLGMHKSADKWQRVGGSMFSSSELQERRRIWYGCVIMDKYVSTYIGELLLHPGPKLHFRRALI